MQNPELLVVDDDPSSIQTLGKILEGLARLRFARSGEEALLMLDERRPDLVLLDLEMPGLDGRGMLAELRDRSAHRGPPVIVVTSGDHPDLESLVLDLGAVDFLSKPLSAAQVLGRVRNQLRLRRALAGSEALPELRGSGSVLVVDDDVSAIHGVRACLQGQGYHLRFATNAATALRMVEAHTPDVVLLDVQMPGMDGFELCETLRSDPVMNSVPIAMITRLSDAGSEARGLALGATDFIAKPYRPAVLLARVRNLVRLRREAEAALRLEREHWRRLGDARVADLVAAASDAVLTVDAQGRIVLVNQSAGELLGLSVEHLVGQDVVTLLCCSPELVGLVSSYARLGAGRHDTPTPSRLLLRRPDGAVARVEPRLFELGEEDARLVTVLLRDCTERDSLEAAERARLEAEASSRSKSQMLSYLAHEIGNPLNGILGCAQLLQMDTDLMANPRHAARLNVIQQSAEMLSSLLQDVMDVGRFETGNFSINPQALDADEAASAAVDKLRAQATAAGIALEFQGLGRRQLISADGLRLQQCLVNLISNGIKYNREGGTVLLRLRVEGGAQLALAVCDTGLGMGEAQLAQLFEPFNRLGRDKGSVRGAGLGLVITRLLARAMGGDVHVSSRLGEGSAVTLVLPLVS